MKDDKSFGYFVKYENSQNWLLTLHQMIDDGEDNDHLQRCLMVAMDEERQRAAIRSKRDASRKKETGPRLSIVRMRVQQSG